MNATLKITRIGNSAGVVLPKEVLARLRVGWDALFLTEAPNGVRLTPHDPNHPLVDGNKRTAWVAARLFLRLKGYALASYELDAIETVLALAAWDLAEDELANRLRAHLAVLDPPPESS